MVFSSTIFLYVFLPITLTVYYLLKGSFRNGWLLCVSLLFFGWSQPGYLWIILISILINYIGALLLQKAGSFEKGVLAIVIVLNLLILFYFKYFNFTVDTINNCFGINIIVKDVVLPIGISFFTFQGMSYVIDAFRKDVQVQKNIFKVALYIVLFPQLIAGPIVRYKDIEREIDYRRITLEDFCYGIERFIIGLGKKTIIANSMAQTADAIWGNGVANNTWMIAWAGSIAYSLQIYYDFSGYSDMAIGLGRMFGFHFQENFRLPYISKSITEFWRRWHISLSSWFRDYVYIPLGGNRKGNVYINLWIVFLLTGMWHGASWHFIIWGIWHGLFIFAERLFRIRKIKCDGTGEKGRAVGLFSRVYTLLVVNFGWVLFRAESTRAALLYVAAMLGIVSPARPGFTIAWYLDRWTLSVFVIGILFATEIPDRISKIVFYSCKTKIMEVVKYALLLLLLLLSMLRIVSGTYNPFIYFQF